jgi:hypothetical protein
MLHRAATIPFVFPVSWRNRNKRPDQALPTLRDLENDIGLRGDGARAYVSAIGRKFSATKMAAIERIDTTIHVRSRPRHQFGTSSDGLPWDFRKGFFGSFPLTLVTSEDGSGTRWPDVGRDFVCHHHSTLPPDADVSIPRQSRGL